MRTINRSAIVVRPAQPFLDWLHQVDPTSIKFTLDDLGKEPSIYLLPEYDDVEGISVLAKFSKRIFEEELEGWWTERSAWPREQGLAEFREWFELIFHSVIFDACPGTLKRE